MSLVKGKIGMSGQERQIIGLQHVQIEAPIACEVAARAFYGTLLGLTELVKPAQLLGRGGIWFACGAQQLHIGVVTDFVPRHKGHPALEVVGLAAWRVYLVAAGVHVSDDEPLPGWQRLYITDPWGNRIELLEHEPEAAANQAEA